MNLKPIAHALALSSMLAIGTIAMPARAAEGDLMNEYRASMTKMANKQGMVTRKDFLAFMAKKFDEMDRKKQGMLTPVDIMRIFGRIDTQ